MLGLPLLLALASLPSDTIRIQVGSPDGDDLATQNRKARSSNHAPRDRESVSYAITS